MSKIESRTAVIGVGGAGCNVVSDIFWSSPSVDTIAINTDRDAMENVYADKKLFICRAITHGQGTDGDSILGKKCAQAHIEEIKEALSGYDVAYIVAGMGGGTGTGAAPIVAEIAQSLGLITFAIAVRPFSFENARTAVAAEGIAKMKTVCKMTTVIENDRILDVLPSASMEAAFHAVNASIGKYIEKQNRDVLSAFREHLKGIGALVDDSESVPAGNVLNGAVTN